jgi:hypothetical protein
VTGGWAPKAVRGGFPCFNRFGAPLFRLHNASAEAKHPDAGYFVPGTCDRKSASPPAAIIDFKSRQMSKDSDLYGDDIRLWSETQSALLRRLSTGESVADQVDWPHVVEEIGHSHAQRPKQQDEIARLTARLTAAEALVKELRSRLDDLSSQLGATKAELATAQDEAETATARAVTAAEAEQALRQADANRRAGGRWARLRAAWRGE